MLSNRFLKGASFAVSGTVLSSMVHCSIGYADKENLDIGSSYSGNLTGLQKGSGDDKAQLQQKELAEVLDIMKINRQQHDDIEKEKEELKKIYEEKMKVINEKRKKNNKDYDVLLERSNSLKDGLGIERDLTLKEKFVLGAKIFMYICLIVPSAVVVTFLIVLFSLEKEDPTLGDVVDEIFKFINNFSKKVSNAFGAENS